MTRLLSVSLSLALLLCSWPAAAVERAAEVRAAPPAAALAPAALASGPALPGAVVLSVSALPGVPGLASSVPAERAAAQGAGSAAAPAALAERANETDGAIGSAAVELIPGLPAAEGRPVGAGASSDISAIGGNVSVTAAGPERSRRARAGSAADRIAGAPAAAAAEDGARLFDGARIRARTAAVAAPAAVLGAAAVPLAGSHLPHLSLAALQAATPQLSAVGYHFATALSVAFPLPEAYAALRRGHARGFPLWRASLGAAGGLALGLINAVMLHKPSWGVMQIFVGLGIIAPYVIGRVLERRGGALSPYVAPAGATGLRAFRSRLSRDRAIWATLGVGAAMLAAAAGLYAAASAVVPPLLAAHLSAHAIADLLLWLQIGKGALFVAVFAPDAVALAHGKPTKGFSFWFTAIYLASVTAYTLWGFSAAALSAAGPIRDQYVVLGLRNAFEAAASALSLLAIVRAARRR